MERLERRAIGRVAFPSRGVLVVCDTQEVLHVGVRDLGPIGVGIRADADTPKGIAFREQFVGTSGSVAVSKDGGTLDAITGATITSRAICVGVNAALDCVANMG